MDSDYDIFEIAAVIRDFWLIDSESYQRQYCTDSGQPLAPGYYVVNWPDHIRSRRFNEHAQFHGPFKSRKEAQISRDWMHKSHSRVQACTLNATADAGKSGPLRLNKIHSLTHSPQRYLHRTEHLRLAAPKEPLRSTGGVGQ